MGDWLVLLLSLHQASLTLTKDSAPYLDELSSTLMIPPLVNILR